MDSNDNRELIPEEGEFRAFMDAGSQIDVFDYSFGSFVRLKDRETESSLLIPLRDFIGYAWLWWPRN